MSRGSDGGKHPTDTSPGFSSAIRRALWPWIGGLAASLAIAFLVDKRLAHEAPLRLAGTLWLTAPSWLRLLALLPLLPLLARGSLAGLGVVRRLVALGLRVVLATLVIVSLAHPERSVAGKDVAVVALVDVSASVSDAQLDEARRYIEALRREAARREKAASVEVVVFAGDARRLDLPPLSSAMPAIPRLGEHGSARLASTPASGARGSAAQEDRARAGEASDLQGALQLAYGLLPARSIPRLILFSDGNQTRGDLLAEAASARARGIRVDVHPYASERGDELMAQGLSAPAGVKVGEPFELVAEVYASRPVTARLTLTRDGAPVLDWLKTTDPRPSVATDRSRAEPASSVSRPVGSADGSRTLRLDAGVNTLHCRARLDVPGRAEYRLEVAAGEPEFHDRFVENNHASVAVRATGRPRVLYVEGDPRAGAPLVTLLGKQRLEVDVRGPAGVPRAAGALERYDLVVLSDVAASSLDAPAMALLDGYLREGGGLLVAGGQNVFGAGGYAGSHLERLLPLRFDVPQRRQRARVALALAIDRSGSMQGEKLELAKDAARASVELLAPTDEVSVIAFDALAVPVARLHRVDDGSGVLDGIARLRAGGGTDVSAALKEADEELSQSAAEVRHVILLTDGQASYEGVAELCDRMAGAGITVSAVGVGDGADQTLLSMIARRGGGRFYFTDDAQDVPQIFTRDTNEAVRPALVEEPTRLRAPRPVELLRGVELSALPPVGGYVLTQARPEAEVILLSERGEPLLARWRVGLGQSAVWTSDVKNRWASSLLHTADGGKLLVQLARALMRARAEEPIDAQLPVGESADRAPGKRAGAPVHSAVSAEQRGASLRVCADVLDENGRFVDGLASTLEVDGAPRPLPQTAPGRYEVELPIERFGSYALRAVHRAADGSTSIVAVGASSLSLPWSREYLALPVDAALLREAARIGAGRIDPSPIEALDPGADSVPLRRDQRPTWILIAVALWVADVLVRRGHVWLAPRARDDRIA